MALTTRMPVGGGEKNISKQIWAVAGGDDSDSDEKNISKQIWAVADASSKAQIRFFMGGGESWVTKTFRNRWAVAG